MPLAASLLVGIFLSSCASLPEEVIRIESYTIADTGDTTLAQLAGPTNTTDTGESRFVMLPSGLESFDVRLALTDLAERSIDIQTFIWKQDSAGTLLAERLLVAAERGIRVRILVDDINNRDRDEALAALDAHPNIEFRIFNPFGTRSFLLPINVRRGWEMIRDMSRLNHRMHNKVFVTDNQAAIVGGRNIADEYFGMSENYNFADLDLLISGAIVDDVSLSFDDYWNSSWAYPITIFTDHPSPPRLEIFYSRMHENVSSLYSQLGLEQSSPQERRQLLQDLISRAVSARAEIVFDSPDKLTGGAVDNATEVPQLLQSQTEQTQSELLIGSPYFIPGEGGGGLLAELADRGVSVKVLTNSLAAADHVSSFSGFSRYRTQVLQNGIELFELKPDQTQFVRETSITTSTGNGGIHAKAFVFDRERVFIGSFNLDPRSININTEIGLLIHSEALAEELASYFEAMMQPQYSWSPTLNNAGDLVWMEKNPSSVSADMIYTSDPKASFWRRSMTSLFRLLPIEKHL
ncbi:MAG: hypothetical protein GKR91_17460 [Pseudomonadales bacterium]|nr:hypothetical protein [Pseudomonadales bacterium]